MKYSNAICLKVWASDIWIYSKNWPSLPYICRWPTRLLIHLEVGNSYLYSIKIPFVLLFYRCTFLYPTKYFYPLPSSINHSKINQVMTTLSFGHMIQSSLYFWKMILQLVILSKKVLQPLPPTQLFCLQILSF